MNIQNVRAALKMVSVIQNLILDLKELEQRPKDSNQHIQKTNELLAIKKRCDIEVEILNYNNFLISNKVDMTVLS